MLLVLYPWSFRHTLVRPVTPPDLYPICGQKARRGEILEISRAVEPLGFDWGILEGLANWRDFTTRVPGRAHQHHCHPLWSPSSRQTPSGQIRLHKGSGPQKTQPIYAFLRLLHSTSQQMALDLFSGTRQRPQNEALPSSLGYAAEHGWAELCVHDIWNSLKPTRDGSMGRTVYLPTFSWFF